MTTPAIQEVEQKLESVLTELKVNQDPDMRRTLLAEMRILMAQLDQLVLDSARSYSARPTEPTDKSDN